MPFARPFQGVEGAEEETMLYNNKDLHKAVICKRKQEGKALWFLKDAKDKGIIFFTIWAACRRSKQDPK